ncbi:MAG TPA: CaiB/BaiF CoA-transferase family protein [Acidimicrobiia bacterium]|nr:CaiB/BaiF CoA-transferase family protein [Acidimicrobiia bacterium]
MTETPLAGLRVLELGAFIAGPFAGQLLGDLGAEVVKVEPPGTGDIMRRYGVRIDGRSLWWPAIARNKQSVAVDLRDARGRDVVRRIASRCDVVIENFKPGTMARWGLDYETLAGDNPGVVLVHVSGFGQSGPRAADPGFGSIGEAMGGIRYTTGEPDRMPARTGVSIGDSLAGLFAVVGALAALNERTRSGRGQEVDVAIYEAVMALMESTVADYELGGVTRTRSGGILRDVAPANAYPTLDGRDVVIAGNADAVFARLCDAMARPDLARDLATHEARSERQDALDDEIAAWTSTMTADDLVARLRSHDVPVGPINRAPDLLSDPHIVGRDMIVRLAAGFAADVPMTGVVPKLLRTPGEIRAVGPALGEHTDAVLRALAQCADAEIASLRDAGVVA